MLALVPLPGHSRKGLPQQSDPPLDDRPGGVQCRSNVDLDPRQKRAIIVSATGFVHVKVQDVAFFFRRSSSSISSSSVVSSVATVTAASPGTVVHDVPVVSIKWLVANPQRREEPRLGSQIGGSSLEAGELHRAAIAIAIGIAIGTPRLPLQHLPPAALVDGIVDLQKGRNGFFLDSLPSLALHGVEDLLLAGIHPSRRSCSFALVGIASSDSNVPVLVPLHLVGRKRTSCSLVAVAAAAADPRNGRLGTMRRQRESLAGEGRLGVFGGFFDRSREGLGLRLRLRTSYGREFRDQRRRTCQSARHCRALSLFAQEAPEGSRLVIHRALSGGAAAVVVAATGTGTGTGIGTHCLCLWFVLCCVVLFRRVCVSY